jgi:pimeloyl-ACP methyl ester carboxylesterase
VGKYPASMAGSATGTADVGKRLAQENTECPDEKFVLVGYSQGGMVVQSALASIPAAIQSKVVAVILYGAGTGSNVAATFKPKTLANCAPADFVSPTIVRPRLRRTDVKQHRLVGGLENQRKAMFRITMKGPNGMTGLLNTSSPHIKASQLDSGQQSLQLMQLCKTRRSGHIQYCILYTCYYTAISLLCFSVLTGSSECPWN